MKKFKYLFILLVALLVLPFAVWAEGEEEAEVTTTGDSKEVHVYLFRGEGCPHCQEAEEWFDSIEEEYGSYFEILDYETWYNEDNAKLMQRVAEARGETAEGVPYIIIGNKSWAGFTADYEDEMLSQIKSEFEVDVDARYDIMKLLPELEKKADKKEEAGSNDVLALIVILVVVGGICFGVYKARNATK